MLRLIATIMMAVLLSALSACNTPVQAAHVVYNNAMNRVAVSQQNRVAYRADAVISFNMSMFGEQIHETMSSEIWFVSDTNSVRSLTRTDMGMFGVSDMYVHIATDGNSFRVLQAEMNGAPMPRDMFSNDMALAILNQSQFLAVNEDMVKSSSVTTNNTGTRAEMILDGQRLTDFMETLTGDFLHELGSAVDMVLEDVPMTIQVDSNGYPAYIDLLMVLTINALGSSTEMNMAVNYTFREFGDSVSIPTR